MILATGFEKAFVGIAQRCGQPDLAVYDYDKAVSILVHRDGLAPDEAADHLEANAVGAWVGPGSPLWLTKMSLRGAIDSQEDA